MLVQCGGRRAPGRRRPALCRLPPPCVLSAFPALQPGTGILRSGQAEESFSELQPGLALWKCRPRLGAEGGGGEDLMGPRSILGFRRWVGLLGRAQGVEWPGLQA